MGEYVALSYYNDTEKDITIHPASYKYDELNYRKVLKAGEMREFFLPIGTTPWLKIWEDYGEITLLISYYAEK